MVVIGSKPMDRFCESKRGIRFRVAVRSRNLDFSSDIPSFDTGPEQTIKQFR